MLTLAAHNQARLAQAEGRRMHPGTTGVACNACLVPLKLANPVRLVGENDGAEVICPTCGHKAVMLI